MSFYFYFYFIIVDIERRIALKFNLEKFFVDDDGIHCGDLVMGGICFDISRCTIGVEFDSYLSKLFTHLS